MPKLYRAIFGKVGGSIGISEALFKKNEQAERITGNGRHIFLGLDLNNPIEVTEKAYKEWQDKSRIYLEEERARDQRIDCSIGRFMAAA